MRLIMICLIFCIVEFGCAPEQECCQEEDGGQLDIKPDKEKDLGERVCMPGTERCRDGIHYRCSEDGSSWIEEPCPGSTTCTASEPRCHCPDDNPLIVRGRVKFPNGLDPVSKALVYVYKDFTIPPRPGRCVECVDPNVEYVAYTFTEPDGSFELKDLPFGSYPLIIEKGLFRRVVDLNITDCGIYELPEEDTRLPKDYSEGDIPKIAVITGYWDHMEEVLAKIGLAEVDSSGHIVWGTQKFDLYNGESSERGSVFSGNAEDLLRDYGRLITYDIVFINCGNYIEDELYFWGTGGILEDPQIQENIRNYVKEGGRLYVTDLSYDFEEHALPKWIDFEGSIDGFVDTPEDFDAAQVGVEGITVQGIILDQDLSHWLNVIGVLQPDNTVPIRGFLEGWAVMKAVDTDDTGKVWVQGEVDYYYGSGELRPLTATFEYGCGRVLYTSYHTVPEETSPELTPQERILEYLILEIGVCLEEINVY